MEIRPGKNAPCELVNEAGEVITKGTHNHCLNVQRRTCEHDMKPTDNWLIDRCSKCGEEHA
jgi:hypothetical protein